MVLTIGHSNHPIEMFIALLARHRVEAVADVRSAPWSRRYPQYRRDELRTALAAHGVDYLFLGAELGARSRDPECFANGRVSFARLAASAPFRTGIARVREECRERRLALACAERDPLDCHRTVLVAPALAAAGVEVAHILADGELEAHERTVARLLALHGLADGDLFDDRDARVVRAFALQEARIAYSEP